jgi:hypothetical protein
MPKITRTTERIVIISRGLFPGYFALHFGCSNEPYLHILNFADKDLALNLEL